MRRSRVDRLLALGTVAVVLSALPLVACNSGSASRSSETVSGATAAAKPGSPNTQTLAEALAAKVKEVQQSR